MNKILKIEEAIQICKTLHDENKSIVLAGGCFDLLHIGHVTFLEEAKKHGDTLIIMIEADETIKKEKGPARPINSQHDRAELLANFFLVDYIILLDPTMQNNDYDRLVNDIKPAIIATTKGDVYRFHKERQAALVGAKVIDVIDPVKNQSTTKLIAILNEL